MYCIDDASKAGLMLRKKPTEPNYTLPRNLSKQLASLG
jgi:hypothetical protein